MKISSTIKAAWIIAIATIIAALIGTISPFLYKKIKRSEGNVERIEVCIPECPSEYIRGGLIEAEDCYKEGKWKSWALAVFSNGLCITNEDSDFKATDLCLCLNFVGAGITIVFRRDTFYGTLTVEIDGKMAGVVNQCGKIKNQVMKYFDAGGMGKHTLILRGSKTTGVITIDAIKI